ncbi:hypothetical protein SAMN02745111_01163 [Eubacterium uniforme]|uniref:Uncharacterized protein n=1 Tax=Eubacterium uniforme TaxID=39495 RepID=A0A1T4VL22_9FIRM|nr:hypothetical protein [Eubacterium uniforme]SKA65674.1 hypothetical protein SAMN02745111_01163 [Eubacterium uniforme]
MKNIKSIVLMTCMVASAFLFSGKNVSAKEFKPDVIGTLSKDGDSVKVKPVNKGTSQCIKYVSSTDELMYVYTDSKNDDPLIGVFDKNGILLGSYDNMVSRDGDYLDLGNTGNTNNAGFFVKIRKGEEYYFEATLNNLSDVGEYNVHLIKTDKKPQVDVYAYNNEEGYITLPNKDIAKLGLSYDKDNYILTMNNTNIPYEIFVNADYEHLFSDGLLEIKIIGKNTITVDYFSFIISQVSIVFTGNGTLSFKKATNDYIPISVLSSEGNAYPVVFRVDGPTFDINVDTEQSPIEVEQLIMDSGKIIYSGNSHKSVIEARIISINGGEIDALSGNVFSSIFSANAIYINGGITKTSVYSNKDDTFALYETVFLGQEDIIINDGTIVVKYIDPEENVESVYVNPTFSSREEININGGNIYIIMSDKLKKYFGDKLAGIQTNTSDKKTPFISNKANIQSGSTIDISKVKCSLEYSDCVYDGKETSR